MKELIEKTERIEKNVKKLITLHSDLRKENLSLESENKQLKETIQKQQEEIRQLINGSKIQQIASDAEKITKPDSLQMKHKINSMIREVDLCLHYLKNQELNG